MGEYHNCVILDDYSTKCWGKGNEGQLGLGSQSSSNVPAGSVDFGSGRTARAIASSKFSNCAVLDDSSLKCFGGNNNGQLGYGDKTNRIGADQMGDSLPTVDLGTGRTAVSLAGGGEFVCAVLENGDVKCWGYNGQGELGLGDNTQRGDDLNEMGNNLPVVDLGTGRTASSISIGWSTACAVLDNGDLKCWGQNHRGQGGQGHSTNIGMTSNEMGDNLPAIDLGAGRTALSVRNMHYTTCVLLDNGSVKCFGQNDHGQCGLGDTEHRGDSANEMGDSLPSVDLGPGRTAVSLFASAHNACALLDDGALKCWGRCLRGSCGSGTTEAFGDEAGEMGINLASIDFGGGIGILPPPPPTLSPTAVPTLSPTETPEWQAVSTSGDATVTSSWSSPAATSYCSANWAVESQVYWGSAYSVAQCQQMCIESSTCQGISRGVSGGSYPNYCVICSNIVTTAYHVQWETFTLTRAVQGIVPAHSSQCAAGAGKLAPLPFSLLLSVYKHIYTYILCMIFISSVSRALESCGSP
jgi:alpha-tubulin suppressor-like RCC1 family protein